VRRVLWSDAARDDYFQILRHIAVDDPDAAERVVHAIEKAGNDLADFATGHPGRVGGTYEKAIRRLPYIIAYALSADDSSLTILHIIHAARNWPSEEWPA